MFGALVIPAVIGGVVGSTDAVRKVWPTGNATKGALVGLGAGLAYSILRANPGISENIDMQRKYFSPGQGVRQALYRRSISAGGLFDRIRLI